MTVELTSTRLVDGFGFGEGPRWHDGRLWFTDNPAGAVKVVEGDRVEVVAEVPQPSGLGWLPDGTMVVSALGAPTVTIGGVPHDLGDFGWTTNDMVVHGEWIYVDVYQHDATGTGGAIALVTHDGQARLVAEDLAVPNGLVVTPDGSTLIVSETWGERLTAFDIGPDGDLTDRRVFAELGEGRHPDGLCLDAEGAAWVGCYDTHEFLRVRDGGEVTHRIPVTGGWAVAPALGGTTVFLVVDDTTHEGLMTGDSRGWIETVEVEVPAAG